MLIYNKNTDNIELVSKNGRYLINDRDVLMLKAYVKKTYPTQSEYVDVMSGLAELNLLKPTENVKKEGLLNQLPREQALLLNQIFGVSKQIVRLLEK